MIQDDKTKSKKIAEQLVAVMLKKETESNQELDEWISDNPSAYEVISGLSDEARLTSECVGFRKTNKAESTEKMLKKLLQIRRCQIFIRIGSAVAAAVAVVSFAIYFVDFSKIATESQVAISEVDENVKLVLDGGEVIVLNSVEDKVDSCGMQFHKTGVKSIAFVAENKEEKDEKVTMNQLVVPKKHSYSVDLCDGTRVVLNAESELIFPSKFKGDKREVTIKGEGYFEVAKDAKVPFIVHTEGMSIRVYGTKFNINCYNACATQTFLLEGSVGVLIGKQEQMLKPNQLITANNNSGESRIENVKNANKYIAWKDGYFVFESDNLSTVISELTRWYNVEFMVGNSSKLDVPITGSFSRETELDEIINSLEIVSGIKLIKK